MDHNLHAFISYKVIVWSVFTPSGMTGAEKPWRGSSVQILSVQWFLNKVHSHLLIFVLLFVKTCRIQEKVDDLQYFYIFARVLFIRLLQFNCTFQNSNIKSDLLFWLNMIQKIIDIIDKNTSKTPHRASVGWWKVTLIHLISLWRHFWWDIFVQQVQFSRTFCFIWSVLIHRKLCLCIGGNVSQMISQWNTILRRHTAKWENTYRKLGVSL